MPALPHAWGGPAGEARLRVEPEDFQVTEIPVCLPDGQGEHLWLRVRKRDSNTEWVAKQLARWAGVGPAQVSYAGLKDRHAVTEQWFSIQLPGQPDPDPAALASDEFHVEEMARHSRKLRRGALKGNHFALRLRDWQGDKALLEQRLQSIAAGGVPNYFGEQRFGHDGGNLEQARRLFAGELKKCPRHQRGLYLSAARSWLFNHIASLRVAAGTWDQALPGDFLQLDGRHAGFVAEVGDGELAARLSALQVHPTGTLWGRGRPQTGEPQTQWEAEQLFSLSAGAYATMVVRELVEGIQ
ncbi:MAG: tRNA pseudouridine(13) synthase TruD [Xanthomonadaceae bacterium]|nr:tRNA pseudouridine(13) synthase TruD [Xanthomonadaceae bacterium]